MLQVVELGRVEELAAYRQPWDDLLRQTPAASFFQSLAWLEIYWRHFGEGQALRVLLVFSDDRLVGIVPLVVRREKSHIGQLRVLTFPLHDWGSFYGPIGPDAGTLLAAACNHLARTPRDWDILELRWLGGIDTNPTDAQRAMFAAGFQAYATIWDHTAIVDLEGGWESYWSARKGGWLRRFRHSERKLAGRGDVSFVRYRPLGQQFGDGSPRWDLYDACEEIARRSWQATSRNGTTLSHKSVRNFLRETHAAAATAGMVDLGLLTIDEKPAAFVYGYHCNGQLYGLRRGYDAELTTPGAGNVLLAYVLRDCCARGDRLYDLGTGSLETKRHFQTRLVPVLRLSHYPPMALRTQLLRVRRWWQSRTNP